jgi:hypothetical protein
MKWDRAPAIVAVVALVLLYLAVGFLVRLTAGRWTRHTLDTLLFETIHTLWC